MFSSFFLALEKSSSNKCEKAQISSTQMITSEMQHTSYPAKTHKNISQHVGMRCSGPAPREGCCRLAEVKPCRMRCVIGWVTI